MPECCIFKRIKVETAEALRAEGEIGEKPGIAWTEGEKLDG
jgi:hypothetical protein